MQKIWNLLTVNAEWVFHGINTCKGAIDKILTPTGISIYLQYLSSNTDPRAQAQDRDCCALGITLVHLTSGEMSSRATAMQKTAFRIRSVSRIQFSM